MTLYQIRITTEDVGQRVSLRYRTGDIPPLTDVVGELEWWEDGTLGVRRRDGALVEVEEAGLVAGRTLPTRNDELE